MGDNFLADAHRMFAELCEESMKRSSAYTKTYLQEYYNTHSFYELAKVGVTRISTRIVNSVISGVNQTHGLPRFLVIMPDKDLLCDMDVFLPEICHLIWENVDWMVRQISMVVRRKKADLLDKKPGAIYAGYPVIVFVCMIRRLQNLGKAQSQKVYLLRAKFNDALNDSVARIEQKIMTINSCNSVDHFDQWGNLSRKGQTCFVAQN